MQNQNLFSVLIFFVILLIGFTLAYLLCAGPGSYASYCVFGGAAIIASIVSAAIKVANQWNRAIVLRLGDFQSLRGPGLFFIIPIIDIVAYWIDTRVITTAFKAEKTLTKDTVPVDVDAVLSPLHTYF